jgi:hypothetical protein
MRSTPKRKFIFDTSGLVFCSLIKNEVEDNCEILVSPYVTAEFSQKKIAYVIEPLTDPDKEYVASMIRRYLNKELSTNYRRGRKTANAGEFESIALSKRLGIPVVIHDRMARTWARYEHVESLHPVELPDTFVHRLSTTKYIEFLTFHCKMRYEPACEKLKLLTGSGLSPI